MKWKAVPEKLKIDQRDSIFSFPLLLLPFSPFAFSLFFAANVIHSASMSIKRILSNRFLSGCWAARIVFSHLKTITDLVPATRYFLAIKAVDEPGSRSALLNVMEVVTSTAMERP